jgi:hypothetical protein
MQKENLYEDREIFVAKEHIIIPDGKHRGTITEVKLRKYPEESYAYVDFYITLTDMEEQPSIKFGVNANISDMSKLGLLMAKAGYQFKAGDEISFGMIKDTFLLKRVEFKTINIQKIVKGQKMEFANIVYETVDFIE